MAEAAKFDLIVVGGGIGGVICLKYARDAGLNALLLESKEGIGGLWRDLPPWQDIQFARQDWTLGDLPIDGEGQASILRNIEAWVERFALGPSIRVNSQVVNARPTPSGWTVRTDTRTYEAKYLIAASGGHNRAVIPTVLRRDSAVREYHSSQLRDPEELRGKRVVVVGGGASAYDLLDLCFAREARKISWVYRSLKWMRPTRRVKYSSDIRLVARAQMLGMSVTRMNRLTNADLRARYAKAGIEELLPEGSFDFARQQLIPGRRAMIDNAARIERHRGQVRAIEGDVLLLSNDERIECDVLLWGTGYAMDLGYLDVDALSGARSLKEVAERCSTVFRSLDAPNLFLLAPGVLDSNTATPWAYAHAAKSIMSHIAGRARLDAPPSKTFTNYFDLMKLLSERDRASYPRALWYLKYLRLALWYPKDRPLPIP